MKEYNENQFIETKDTELSLRHLAFYVVRRWRVILFFTLAVVLAVALVVSGQTLLELSKDGYQNPQAIEYARMQENYNAQIKPLEDEILILQNSIDESEAYMLDSIKMQIDANHVTTSSLEYYIDTREQMLQYTTDLNDNNDYADTLMKMYVRHLTSGTLGKTLMEYLPEIKDEKYVSELLSVQENEGFDTITISFIGFDSETQQTILDIIRSYMNDIYVQASALIGEHELTEIFSNTVVQKNTKLFETQKANYDALDSLNEQMLTKAQSLEDLQKSKQALSFHSLWYVVAIRLIKAMLYAAFASIILIVVFLSFKYIVSDTMFEIDKLGNLSHMVLLGKVPQAVAKRRLFSGRGPKTVDSTTQNTDEHLNAVKLTAHSIYTAALAKGIQEGTIALISSIPMEELCEFTDMLNAASPGGDLRFAAVGNPMRDVSSADEIASSSVTVLVEKQNVSSCTVIRNEVARITAWGKPALGIVILNADEV